MKLTVEHKTTYNYETPVSYGLQQVRLSPINDALQEVLDWSVDIEGGEVELSFSDQYNNKTLLVKLYEQQCSISVTASGSVKTKDTAGVLGKVYGHAPLWHFQQFTDRTKPGKRIKKLSRIIEQGDDKIAALHNLSSEILEMCPYTKSTTFADTKAEEALAVGGGVCQDHSQIFIAAARFAGLPARYISGYLMINDQVHQEATHAWAEVHVDGIGWVGFDVSNRISPDDRYIRLATGRDSSDVVPIKGIQQGARDESMVVSLQVQQ